MKVMIIINNINESLYHTDEGSCTSDSSFSDIDDTDSPVDNLKKRQKMYTSPDSGFYSRDEQMRYRSSARAHGRRKQIDYTSSDSDSTSDCKRGTTTKNRGREHLAVLSDIKGMVYCLLKWFLI